MYIAQLYMPDEFPKNNLYLLYFWLIDKAFSHNLFEKFDLGNLFVL